MSAEICVANLAIVSDQDVLLLQRSSNLDNPGRFGLVGGIRDSGDRSAMAAAFRELYEETGISPDDVQIAAEGEYMIDEPKSEQWPDGRLLRVYVGLGNLLIPRPDIRLQPSEHVSHRWVDIDQLIEGELSDGFYEKLLPGIPTFLANLYARREIQSGRTTPGLRKVA